jgi:hypothetical protein
MPRKIARKSRSPVTPALRQMSEKVPELFAYYPEDDGTDPALSRSAGDASDYAGGVVVVGVYKFSHFERLGESVTSVSREVVE